MNAPDTTKTLPPALMAALDLGTNNCRLLIAESDNTQAEGFRIIDSFSRIVRLGEGLGLGGTELTEGAIGRTLEALGFCQRKLAKFNITHARAVATEACRRAANGSEFLKKANTILGMPLEIIDCGEEARLAMLGCKALFTQNTPYALMFDIGGGSTEIIWVKIHNLHEPELIDFVSIPWGVVTYSDKYGSDVIAEPDYRSMVETVRESLNNFEAKNNIVQHVENGTVQMVGSSGTVTTLAGVLYGLSRYQRSLIDGCTIKISEARTVTEQIRALDYNGRAEIPCIGTERADLVVAGCAILQGIYETWPLTEFRVGDRGLREGILTDLLKQAQAL